MVSFREKFGKKIGTVVGLGRKWNELKIVVAFSQRQDSPFSGEFLIVEEEEGKRRKLLCFVEDPVYGDYATSSDYRERILVEKYLRELEQITTPLTEEEKKSLFFRCYFVRVIGEIENNEGKYEIKSVYRYLPELTSICRYPNEEEYKAIVNVGMESTEENMLYIGNFAVGDDECKELKIGIEKSKILHVERNSFGIVEKTNGRRTAVLARTGYGKSNLCKVVLLSLITKTDFPSLICDLNGEYAVSSVQGRGFLDIEGVRNKVVVYTEKDELLSKYPTNCFHFKIDFKSLSGRDVATLISFKETETETAGVRQLRSLSEEEWRDIVVEYEKAKSRLLNYSQRRNSIERGLEGKGFRDAQIRKGLSWRIVDILDSLHDPCGRYIVDEVLFFLACGITVILDLSLKDVITGLSVMSFLADKIMINNIRAFAGSKNDIVPCILVVEEAQNVLSSQIKGEGRDVFIKIAKEGRKFGISLIYITQQPGSIDESILSQTDNFFVMHLLNEEDIRALQKANFHYSGCISNFLRNEALVGNVYIYSAPYQPYVFSARVFDFESISSDNLIISESLLRVSIEEIIKQAQKKISEKNIKGSIHTCKNVDEEIHYIKIGRLQYLLSDLNLPRICFEADKKLKYQYTKALAKIIKKNSRIDFFIDDSKGNKVEGLIWDQAFTDE